MTPPVFRRVADLRAAVAGWRAAGARVGVVPTMGALHAGHLSLVRAARRGCDRVIVTIFVNPAQFNNPEDLLKYPRTEQADLALLSPCGVDAVLSPPVDEVYPSGFATTVAVAGVSDPLEGAHRPGHFAGVATVVAKLFGMTQADRAYFGEKDWQQLQVIRRMATDLDLAVEVIGCPTLRDPDGLAMSSRNARLSPAARTIAPALHRAMRQAASAIRDGTPPGAAMEAARGMVLAAGFSEIDYLDLRDAASLGPPGPGPARIFAAAWLDGVRLIDNLGVGEE
ncbi:MAG: pantoate--beta-alanine ligase [Paracoccaceae bacterium]|nr:MAG: pantoate--beta-alanine ligase [Paracoccaceae bacterium]